MKKTKKIKNKPKVLVAMSGGIDSSVAAALIKKKGFDVIGVFMKFWTPPEDNRSGFNNRCCTPESEIRARKVAKILGIPFYVLDFKKEFKEKIVDYFIKGQKMGLTPNPCIICNQEIKFGLLFEKALALDADFIATGHYAQIKNKDSRFYLFEGKDKKKDQSYFLWTLKQNQLKKIMFPLASYRKNEVKKIAQRLKLPFSGIKESQEICFVPGHLEDFLKRYLKEKPGKIVDKKGNILGGHKGLWFYTIGQRKGINLPGGPWYVLAKKPKKRLLVVTKNKKDLLRKEFLVKKVNWVLGKKPPMPLSLKVKIRYGHQPSIAHIYKLQNTKKQIIFDKSQSAITPGQSAVFYQGQEVLGGGIIC